MAGWMCHRCGGTTREEIDGSHGRCAECGQEFTFGRVIGVGPDPDRSPEELAELDRLYAEMRRRPDARFEARPFPVYGLDDQWRGLRFIGGSGRSNGETSHLGVAYGDPVDPDAAHVRVETSPPRSIGGTDRRDPRVDRMLFAKQLAGHLWRETGVMRADVRAAAFALVAIDDFGPYYEGSAELPGRMRRHRDDD